MKSRIQTSCSEKSFKIVRQINKNFKKINIGNFDTKFDSVKRSHLLDQIKTDEEKNKEQPQKLQEISDNCCNQKFLCEQPKKKRGMKTLILDLDETLVHASFSPSNEDYILNVI